MGTSIGSTSTSRIRLREKSSGATGCLPLNKENAQGHGLGLKSIRAAIERYEGTLQIEARDGRFALNILIPREMAGSSN